jgi:hypothetical protein
MILQTLAHTEAAFSPLRPPPCHNKPIAFQPEFPSFQDFSDNRSFYKMSIRGQTTQLKRLNPSSGACHTDSRDQCAVTLQIATLRFELRSNILCEVAVIIP